MTWGDRSRSFKTDYHSGRSGRFGGAHDNIGLTRGFWPLRSNGPVSVQPSGTKTITANLTIGKANESSRLFLKT